MKSQILFLPLALILSVTVFVLLIKPEWDLYQSKKEQIEQEQQKLDNFKSNYDKVKSSADKFKEADDAQISKIDNAVPADPRKDSLISDFFYLSDKENVLISGVSFSKKDNLTLAGEEKEADNKEEDESKGEIKVSEVGLTLSGDYFDLRSFVYSLERMIRVNTIESAAFSVNDKDDTIDLGVEFDVYHREDLEKELVFQAFPDKQGWQDIINTGFSVDFIESFNKNKGDFHVFDPDLSSAGKDNLFERGGNSTSDENFEDKEVQDEQEEQGESDEDNLETDEEDETNEEDETEEGEEPESSEQEDVEN
ncbi:MAG: hypothetical protein ACOCUF_02405 [Patescibacteria group bacterium]